MRKMKLGTACLLLLFSAQTSNAQQSVNAAGGDMSGSSGSVAFSVGQPFYNVSGTSATITEGVQQPVDLTVGVDEIPNIDIVMDVFPNPAYDVVHLKIDALEQDLSLRLIDGRGKLLRVQEITQQETAVSVVDLPVGTYYLEVFLESNRFKTITLIKH